MQVVYIQSPSDFVELSQTCLSLHWTVQNFLHTSDLWNIKYEDAHLAFGLEQIHKKRQWAGIWQRIWTQTLSDAGNSSFTKKRKKK